MKLSLQKSEVKSPDIFFNYKDLKSEAASWTITNSLDGNRAVSVINMDKGQDIYEVSSSTIIMELKFAGFAPSIGDAKPSISFNSSDQLKNPRLERWCRVVSPIHLLKI